MDQCVRDLLQPYFPDFDLNDIDVDPNSFLAWAMGVQAFTIGNDLNFQKGFYNPSSATGIALIGHELTHSQQYKGSGSTLAFLSQYLQDYMKNRDAGMDKDAAYQNIPFEQEAFKKQQEIYNNLVKKYGATNPCPTYCPLQ